MEGNGREKDGHRRIEVKKNEGVRDFWGGEKERLQKFEGRRLKIGFELIDPIQ